MDQRTLDMLDSLAAVGTFFTSEEYKAATEELAATIKKYREQCGKLNSVKAIEAERKRLETEQTKAEQLTRQARAHADAAEAQLTDTTEIVNAKVEAAVANEKAKLATTQAGLDAELALAEDARKELEDRVSAEREALEARKKEVHNDFVNLKKREDRLEQARNAFEEERQQLRDAKKQLAELV